MRQTQLAYRDALNYVSRYAFAHGKMSNTVGLQEGTYQDIRSRFGLPAQMACSVAPPGRRDLQGAVDEGEGQCGGAVRRGATKKRYQGLGPGAASMSRPR